MKISSLLCATVLSFGTAMSGIAQAEDFDGAIKARKSLMQLYAHYLGTLGGMAKGEVEYNAEQASAAANSLVAMMSADQTFMWPPGSDTEALGDKTAALAVGWTSFPAILEKGEASLTAAKAMADVAGTDLASLQGAMGQLGKSCGGCHKEYRLKKE